MGKDQPPDLAALVPSEATVLPDQVEKSGPSQLPSENHLPLKIKSTEHTGKTVSQTKHPQGAVLKPKSASDSSVAITDVRKFIDKIIDKTTETVSSEIQRHGDQLKPAVLDDARKRLSADLEFLITMFKNTAYTEGFSAGVESVFLRR